MQFLELLIWPINPHCFTNESLQVPTTSTRVIPYAFPANQVMSYFLAFILVLVAICLVIIHVIISVLPRIIHITLACQVPSSHVGRVPQQLSSRQNGKFHGQCIAYLFSLPMPFSVLLSSLTNNYHQCTYYYVITNFYLIWNISHYSDDNIVISQPQFHFILM